PPPVTFSTAAQFFYTDSRHEGNARDPGLAVVDYIFQHLNIDPEWSVRDERGFTWWGGELAQRVWAGPVYEDLGVRICRVQLQTDLLENFNPTPKNISLLGATAAWSTMSGPVLTDRSVRMVTTTYVHAETLEQ